MLALFFALFIEMMAITIAIQISSQREVIGSTIDVIVLVGVTFVMLAIYFRFMHGDVKDKAFFGIFFIASIVLGLAEVLSLIVRLNYFNPMSLSRTIIVGFLFETGNMFAGLLLAFLIGSFLGDKSDYSWFRAFTLVFGLSLEVYMSLFLTVANWGLLQEGVLSKLLSVMLAFSLAGTVAYFMDAMIVSSQEEARVDDKKDEVDNPTLELQSPI
jgi:hypothetical protein